jgi:hypothetical protein
MKTLSGTIKYALVTVALFTIVGCKKKCAEVAEVRPGYETSEKGCANIDQILAKYDKSLYRFQKFENGEFRSEEGTLSPEDMPPGTIDSVTKEAKVHKLTGCAIQAGRCVETHGSSSTAPMAVKKMTDLWKLEQVLKDKR